MTIRTHLIATLALLTPFAAMAAPAATAAPSAVSPASGDTETTCQKPVAATARMAPGSKDPVPAPSNHAISTKGTGCQNTRVAAPSNSDPKREVTAVTDPTQK
jgi:hypothetical protein